MYSWIPGDALTVYTAKRGLHVALIEYNTERENDPEGSGGVSKGPVRLGVLQAPTRLAVQAVLDAGSGGGSGASCVCVCPRLCLGMDLCEGLSPFSGVILAITFPTHHALGP